MHRKQAMAMAYKLSVVQVANIRVTSERTHWLPPKTSKLCRQKAKAKSTAEQNQFCDVAEVAIIHKMI
jgi:hypothetical protein